MPSRGVRHRKTKKKAEMWAARRESGKTGLTFREALEVLRKEALKKP